jgi:hypothetical protein
MLTMQEIVGKIQQFSTEISSQQIYQASHQPEQDARPSCCFQNVWAKISKDGGNILFGWIFHYRINPEYGGYLIATHHAVWCTPDNLLTDVTPFTEDPKHHPITLQNHIIFLVDELAQPFDNGAVIAPLALKFFPLGDDPNLKAYLTKLAEEEEKACQDIYDGRIDPKLIGGLFFKS